MHQVFDERRQVTVSIPELPKPETHILKRTDMAPLKFQGVKIAETGRDVEHVGKFDRWYEMALYAVEENGKRSYVLELAYRTNIITTKSAVDESYFDAVELNGAREVWDYLDNFDATRFVVGVPEGVTDANKKNRRIRQFVQKSFDDAFADLQFKAAFHDDAFADPLA